jgi:3-oxoacyl-(acyl-carrier-protein) synthase
VGVLAPNAHGPQDFVAALRSGRSGIRYHARLRELNFGCQVGGVPIDAPRIAEQLLTTEERFALNESMLYGLIASIGAWQDAGLSRPDPQAREPDWGAGAILGTGVGGIDTIAGELAPRTDAGKVARMGSSMVERVMASGGSARLAGMLALGNQVTTNSSACSTGTEAVCMAFSRIKHGEATRMLAGGCEGSSHYIWAGFDAMRVLNRKHNGEPERASRPLSASAGGFVPGSGAAALVLEELEAARARGAHIYAEILGAHVNCGGHVTGGSITAQNPHAVRACIRGALTSARIRPADIDFINGHLTATGADAAELVNWSEALNVSPAQLPTIQATKSLIGHCLGAAGAIECAAAVLQLANGFIHPSINCEDLNPEVAAYAGSIARELQERPGMSVAIKASFGFGDVNSCVVFRKYA